MGGGPGGAGTGESTVFHPPAVRNSRLEVFLGNFSITKPKFSRLRRATTPKFLSQNIPKIRFVKGEMSLLQFGNCLRRYYKGKSSLVALQVGL